MSKPFARRLIVTVFTMALGLGTVEQATATPILALFTSPGTGTLRTGDGFTLGSKFSVGSKSAVVSSLGVWDSTGSGLAAATPVDIWDSLGNVVASAIVAQGTSDLNQFSYISISPVTLLANQSYVIGAYYFSSSDPAQLRNDSSTPGTSPDFNSFSAVYTSLNTAGSITEPGPAPGLGGTAAGVAYTGPNFLYAVPEPSTFVLASAGLFFIAARSGVLRECRTSTGKSAVATAT